MNGFVVVGSIVALAGIALVVVAIRNRGDGTDPKMNAMLIAGTMAAAFGIVLAGFVIAFNAAAPLDLNTGASQ
jgi:uncharacterized membrane protein HdeD (DUF308 family)